MFDIHLVCGVSRSYSRVKPTLKQWVARLKRGTGEETTSGVSRGDNIRRIKRRQHPAYQEETTFGASRPCLVFCCVAGGGEVFVGMSRVSCLVLSCLVFVLSCVCLALSCLALSCLVFVLSCLVLSYLI